MCTIGHFDGVHLGHIHVIDRMRQLAMERGYDTTVAVTFDRHPRTLFDASFRPQMLTTVEERTLLLSQSGVDACVVLQFDHAMASLTAREFMEKILRDMLHVRLLVLGYDNRFGRKNAAEGFEDYVAYGRALGIEVVACDKMLLSSDESAAFPAAITDETVSSTHIRNLLSDGDVREAMRCLGHPYTIEGTVVEGYQEGRKIGFPTANVVLPSCKIVPVPGVYAVKVRVEGSMSDLHGMMNIGTRPTYGDYGQTLEVHIFHFSDNIYGRRLRIEFHQRLRNEQQFPSVGKLAEQLREDAKEAERVLKTHPLPLP